MNLRARRSRTLLYGLLPCLAYGSATAAQELPRPLDSESRTAIVRELADVLRLHYVLEETGAGMAELITSRLDEGAYEHVTEPVDFARLLTDDLRGVFMDRHLAVLPPDRYREFNRRVSGDHGPGGHGPSPGAQVGSSIMDQGQRASVGVLTPSGFDGSAAGLRRLDDAMASLVGVDALVVDLRGSPGGDADAVRHLSSFLFAEPTHLVSSIGPRDELGRRSERERWTTPSALSSEFRAVPVYVLIDGETFSAAESFAFGLQVTGRATLVGQPTGGGGHMNAPFGLPHGFGASISVGRTYDPRTGAGWQSTGVTPDVRVDAERALETALTLIRRTRR